MLEKDPLKVAYRILEFEMPDEISIGVVGTEGLPAFSTNISVDKEIFKSQKETFVKSENELIFFKPLLNENRCYGCHDPKDKTLGMIIIKNSMKKVNAEVNKTAKRLVFFAIFVGIISEVFLIVVLRKLILIPLSTLNRGAEILKTGRLDYRIDLKKDDEIGTLVSCFNEMADSIEKSHVNLENAVRQRTKELRAIAELSLEVFKGDLSLREIIDQSLNVITTKMGYDHAAVCLVDKETGIFLQEFTKGLFDGLCRLEISLSSSHPFAGVVREARPSIRKSVDIGLPDTFGNIAIIPLLLHQRKCWEVNLCNFENCPAFNGPDERCWLISNTLCRSPQAVAGKEKIYGCLRCDVFPVIGVLIAGKKEDITKTSLHSLEILSSEIASAIENQRLIEAKKEDVNNLVKLHDISVEALQSLNINMLAKSIVSSASVFANMDGAILYLNEKEETLFLKSISEQVEREFIPESITVTDECLIGRAVIEERSIETIKMQEVKCLSDLIEKYGFLYVAAVPINFKGTTYGCLVLFKKRDFFMTDSEKAIIQLFASQSAAAINTAYIYKELAEEKEFSDAILSNMTMGVMVFDGEGRVIRSNPAALDILKIDDYIIGKKLDDVFISASDFLVIDPSLGREIEVTVGSNIIPIGFSNSPIYDINYKRTGTVVVFRDLTEIRKLQAEIKKRHQLEAMGKVIAGVAHEIRNPLFGISSIVQILDREIKSEQQHNLLQTVIKEIYRLKNLIDELLLYSRPSRLNIIDVDMYLLIEKITHYINAKKSTVVLNHNIQPSIAVRADADKLSQVLLNLVDNAIGAGSKKIDITTEAKDNAVKITVKDNGIGIKKDTMERIFDPFFTTKKDGTGLGLSICKKIVEDHGGTISVQSTEGEGTTVILALPL
jgi:signal transduction histidine kinase/HAMP domain-containing protein